MFFLVFHSDLYNQFRLLNRLYFGHVGQGDEHLPATGHLLDFNLSVSLGHVAVKRGRFLDKLVRKRSSV